VRRGAVRANRTASSCRKARRHRDGSGGAAAAAAERGGRAPIQSQNTLLLRYHSLSDLITLFTQNKSSRLKELEAL